MPLGSTWGREKLEGFTWGFRPALLAYPTSNGRGVGAGAYAEYLIDARTHTMWSYGAIASAPVVKSHDRPARRRLRRRARQRRGRRRSATPGAWGADRAGVTRVFRNDFRVGLRLDGTFDDRGMSATSLLLELDVIPGAGALATPRRARAESGLLYGRSLGLEHTEKVLLARVCTSWRPP